MLYEAHETFAVGGSKVLRSTEQDDVTLVGAGVTLHECVKAAELLAAEGIQARVVDCYSVKPIDAATLSHAAAATPDGSSWPRTTIPKAGWDRP